MFNGRFSDGAGFDTLDNGGLFRDFVPALYFAWEIPIEEGDIEDGAAVFGPIWEVGVGPLEWTANAFFAIPFADGEDVAFEFATSLAYPIPNESFKVGVEAFGDLESLFSGDAPSLDEQEFFVGPAVYFQDLEVFGNELEPRLALLFGVTDEAADIVLSINFEYPIEPEGHHDD